MADNMWRGAINQILYGLIFTPELNVQKAAEMAANMVERRSLRGGADSYFDAIGTALASDEPLVGEIETAHSDTEFRAFLALLRHELDNLRPWPAARFTKLDIAQWTEMATAQPIARIELSSHSVYERVTERFDKLPVGDGEQQGLVLRLRSGVVIGLLAPADQRARGVILLLPEGDPDTIITEFTELAALRPEQITPLA